MILPFREFLRECFGLTASDNLQHLVETKSERNPNEFEYFHNPYCNGPGTFFVHALCSQDGIEAPLTHLHQWEFDGTKLNIRGRKRESTASLRDVFQTLNQ